jgi:uncharacterized membrane protein YfcA
MILSPPAERRLFQITVLVATIVPIAAGGRGVLIGPAMIHGALPAPPDLDSHFRYLSGLLLGIGLAFAWAVPRVDRRAGVFRVLGLIVIVGGLGRLLGAIEQDAPGTAHRFALVMELVVVPALLLWLGRLERTAKSATSELADS